jgi:membrane protein DedA with SNARE-associated domain
VQDIVSSLIHLDPTLVILAVLAIAFLENLLPPFPSDVLVVAAGSLVGLGTVGFASVLIAAAVGSTVGFIVMYHVGKWFGHRILAEGRLPFVPPEAVRTVHGWFERYGYWLIIANRFLAGTRAVIAFFAGMSDLRLGTTIALSFVSALLWNGILVTAGFVLGSNWERVGFYLSTYSQVVTGIVILVVIVLVIRYFSTRNGRQVRP